MSLRTQCPHCSATFTFSEEFLGRRAKCRRCGQQFRLASSGPPPLPARPRPEALPSKHDASRSDAQESCDEQGPEPCFFADFDKIAEAEQAEEASARSKKCPFCAETIRANAKKCRFCGEVIDAPAILSRTIVDLLRSLLPVEGVHVSPDIPDGKLANAVERCAVPPDEEILGLIDLTAGGSAKNCLVFGRSGIYFHNHFLFNLWDSKRARGGFVSYDDFPTCVFQSREPEWPANDTEEVTLNGRPLVNMGFSELSAQALIDVFDVIKGLMTGKKAR
jgi:predicted Zn finger-like uncharacterized protein